MVNNESNLNDETQETVNTTEIKNTFQKTIMSKDEEIKALKAKLSDAQKVNKLKVGDIRAEVNRQGDAKKICIGVDDFGIRIWRRADKLTDAEITMRDNFIKSIKQQNAKKYN